MLARHICWNDYSPARFSHPSASSTCATIGTPPTPIFPPSSSSALPPSLSLPHRNATSSAKKATLVVRAGVCSSTASAGAHGGQTGCGIRKQSKLTRWRSRLTYCGWGSSGGSHVPLSPPARPKLAVSWAQRAWVERRQAELAANAGRSRSHLMTHNISNFPSLLVCRPSQVRKD
jgi:hypothetical protein